MPRRVGSASDGPPAFSRLRAAAGLVEPARAAAPAGRPAGSSCRRRAAARDSSSNSTSSVSITTSAGASSSYAPAARVAGSGASSTSKLARPRAARGARSRRRAGSRRGARACACRRTSRRARSARRGDGAPRPGGGRRRSPTSRTAAARPGRASRAAARPSERAGATSPYRVSQVRIVAADSAEHARHCADRVERTPSLRHLPAIPCSSLPNDHHDHLRQCLVISISAPPASQRANRPTAAVEALLASRHLGVRDRLRGSVLDGLSRSPSASARSAAEHDIALSVHAPIAGFMGHAERGKKLNMAVRDARPLGGDREGAGAKSSCFHPGFLLGRDREDAIDAVVEQLGRAARAARGQGSRRAVRDRGDGTRARARVDRRRLRDRRAARLGAPGDRLRAHARHLRWRVHDVERSPRRSRRPTP